MKIGIDAISPGGAIFATRGGVRTHIANLLDGLESVAPQHEYLLFCSRHGSDVLSGGRSCGSRICPSVPVSRIGRVLYEQIVYPVLISAEKLDAFLGTSNTLPLVLRCPSVVILQTLQYFYFPASFSPLRRRYLQEFVPWSLRRANRVIAVSEFEKKDAVRLMKVDENKIHVVRHGVAPFWFRDCNDAPTMEKWLQELTRGKPFLVSVSTLYHFKNYRRLVEAFAKLKKQHGIPHQLIIAGSDADFTAQELTHVAELHQVREYVVCAGHLGERQLRYLYRRADAMVYPSLYETFGLPLLEAMAAGCPVVAARATSLPEVAADAAEFVDPYETASIAEGIWHVISNPARREELRNLGNTRARLFTWEESAKATLQVLAAACSN